MPGVHCCECLKMFSTVLNPFPFDMLLEAHESLAQCADVEVSYL